MADDEPEVVEEVENPAAEEPAAEEPEVEVKKSEFLSRPALSTVGLVQPGPAEINQLPRFARRKRADSRGHNRGYAGRNVDIWENAAKAGPEGADRGEARLHGHRHRWQRAHRYR